MVRTSECCERCYDECVQLHGLSENEQYYTRVTAAINIIWPIQKTRGHKVKLSFEHFVRYPRHMSNGYSIHIHDFLKSILSFLFNTPVLATSRSDNSQPSTRRRVAEITFLYTRHWHQNSGHWVMIIMRKHFRHHSPNQAPIIWPKRQNCHLLTFCM